MRQNVQGREGECRTRVAVMSHNTRMAQLIGSLLYVYYRKHDTRRSNTASTRNSQNHFVSIIASVPSIPFPALKYRQYLATD